MRGVRRKVLIWLSFFTAIAVFVVAESFFYPLLLTIENLLAMLVEHTNSVSREIVNTLDSYAFAGGLAISGLLGLVIYLILVTRARASLAHHMLTAQEWLEELYDEAPVPYFLMEPRGALLSPNKAALRLFGCTADVLALLTLKDVVVASDRERLDYLLDRFRHSIVINGELLRIESKNKTERFILLSVFPGGKAGQSSGKALVNMVDISEQKRLENELRAQFNETQKFFHAAESSADGVVITDVAGNTTYVNRAWTNLTGFSKEDAVGENIRRLWGASTEAAVLAKVDEALDAKTTFTSEELIHQRKDGREYNAEIEIVPIADQESGDVQFYVYTERDISQRKAIDRAKSEFVSLAAHQLRTPMLSMQWYAEMMLSGDAGALSAKQREYVERMHNGSRNLVELVHLFLDVSKIEMGSLAVKLSPTVPNPIIESVLEELQPNISKKNLHIETKIGPLKEITTDPRLLRVVMQNVVSNAVKYTPAEGTIMIALEEDKDNLIFSVRDTGCGIPTEQQHLIFSKMFRAHNAAKIATHGFGLGLYMTKSIVESLGGSIWFTSVLDQGTTFNVMLPRTPLAKSQV